MQTGLVLKHRVHLLCTASNHQGRDLFSWPSEGVNREGCESKREKLPAAVRCLADPHVQNPCPTTSGPVPTEQIQEPEDLQCENF